MNRIDGSSLPPTRAVLVALTGVATIATLGSLYFSEVLGLVPCDLCWYQRILMYPLVVVLGVGALENRPGVWRTVLPLSTGGLLVAAYHTWLQLQPAAFCSFGGGCTAILYSAVGGVVTIPRLSLFAFALLTLGCAAIALSERR